MSLTFVVGLFSGRLGLETPKHAASRRKSTKKIFVYGGSSSFGSISSQYLSHAGYEVVTTSSHGHRQFVCSRGAISVLDHRLPSRQLRDEITAHGPYDIIVDTISLPETIEITAHALAAQGGGRLYTTQPAFGPEHLPKGVNRVFERWSDPLYEDRNHDLREWLVQKYFPQASQGEIRPIPIVRINDGLRSVNQALRRTLGGLSGEKLVADPWK